MFPIRDIIVIAALILSVPLCFFRPTYGAAAWIVVSFVSPQFYGWGLARALEPDLSVAVATVLGFLVFSRNIKGLFCREIFWVAILWTWFSLTTLNSLHNPVFAEKADSAIYQWSMLSKILLMTLLIVCIIDTWERFRWLVLAIAGSFAFLSVKTLPMMIVSGGGARLYGPEHSMIADNNDFGLALNMALPFFFFLAKTEQSRRMKQLMVFVFVVTIPVIIFTYSRGALLGLIAVLLCMLWQSKQRLLLLPFTVLVCCFAMFFTPQEWRDRMKTISPDSLDSSALSRINAWTYSWNMTNDYPIMGGGFDAFTPSLFRKYAPHPEDVHGPHSIYFGVMAEHGFVGLALYLGLAASCFFSLRRLAKTARAMDTPHIAAYANIFSLSLVGFMTSGAFLGRAYFDFFFTIVGCVAILKHVSHAQWAQQLEEFDSASEDGDETVIADPEANVSRGYLQTDFAL